MHVFSKIHKFPIQLCFISIMKLKYIHISTQNWHASILAHTRSCHKQIQSVCDWRITPPPLTWGMWELSWELWNTSLVLGAHHRRCPWPLDCPMWHSFLLSLLGFPGDEWPEIIKFNIYLYNQWWRQFYKFQNILALLKSIASNNKKAYIEEKLVHVLKTTVIIKDTYFTA